MIDDNIYEALVSERGTAIIPELLRGNTGNVGEIGPLLDLAADEIEALRSTISRLREYAGHKDECNWWRMQEIEPLPIGETRCDCGYDALLKELEGTKRALQRASMEWARFSPAANVMTKQIRQQSLQSATACAPNSPRRGSRIAVCVSTAGSQD